MANFPKPQDIRQSGEKPEGGTFVVRRNRSRVHVPEILEGAQKNHIYTKAVDENGNPLMAYVEVPFDPAANQFPKLLYHPDWGKKAEPTLASFARGASTTEQYAAALDSYNAAHAEWEKGNRTKVAENAKREAELRKIGWVDYADLPHKQAVMQKTESDVL